MGHCTGMGLSFCDARTVCESGFSAPFGQVAYYTSVELGWECAFITSVDTSHLGLPYRRATYRVRSGELPQRYEPPRSFEDQVKHAEGIHRAATRLADSGFEPDLVVGHLSQGTLVYMRQLFSCPLLGYFEMLRDPWSSGFGMRREFDPSEFVRGRAAFGQSYTHMQLHLADAIVTPTVYQYRMLPEPFRSKARVIFDGVDTTTFRPRMIRRPVTVAGKRVERDTKVVTYASHGLESTRGFDVFIEAVARLSERHQDLRVLIAGEPRSIHGHERAYLREGVSFRDFVLQRVPVDRERVRFLGWLSRVDLATMFDVSDVHCYLTVPYVLGASCVEALASGCCVVASDTEPVREFIQPDVNGRLVDFPDVGRLAAVMSDVLMNPVAHLPLRENARRLIESRCGLRRCLPVMVRYMMQVAGH